MRTMADASDFLGSVRRRMRFGDLSRQPLHLLRLEVTEEGRKARCDWMMRANDLWDTGLSQTIRENSASMQALCDAIRMRELILRAFPLLESAEMRVFRQNAAGARELIMEGEVRRDDVVPPKMPSIVMRAKLFGYRFFLADGALRAIQPGGLCMGTAG